jgi:hypothetical protein
MYPIYSCHVFVYTNTCLDKNRCHLVTLLAIAFFNIIQVLAVLIVFISWALKVLIFEFTTKFKAFKNG